VLSPPNWGVQPIRGLMWLHASRSFHRPLPLLLLSESPRPLRAFLVTAYAPSHLSPIALLPDREKSKQTLIDDTAAPITALFDC
jgi:hypothetical protein